MVSGGLQTGMWNSGAVGREREGGCLGSSMGAFIVGLLRAMTALGRHIYGIESLCVRVISDQGT